MTEFMDLVELYEEVKAERDRLQAEHAELLIHAIAMEDERDRLISQNSEMAAALRELASWDTASNGPAYGHLVYDIARQALPGAARIQGEAP